MALLYYRLFGEAEVWLQGAEFAKQLLSLLIINRGVYDDVVSLRVNDQEYIIKRK